MTPLETTLRLDSALDLRRSVGPLGSGFADPTLFVGPSGLARGTRTPEGPAALWVERTGPDRLLVRAWGEGAEWVLERAGDLVGRSDRPPDPETLDARFRGLARRSAGLRLPRTHRVFECLSLVVLQQLVQGREAARAWRLLVRAISEPAPGPLGKGSPSLWLPPSPEAVRAIAPARFPTLGILARQGETLKRVADVAERLEEASAMAPDDAERRLRAVRGVGCWSARCVMLRALGAEDAVPEGDWGLPSLVAFHLAGEPKADDTRMLELLEPVRGVRGRAVRWIAAAGRHPPRLAPRSAMRPLPRAPRGL